MARLLLQQWIDANGQVLSQKLIPHLVVKRTSDDTQVLRLVKHVTSSDKIKPILVLFDSELQAGVEYEALSLEDDGTVISREIATAE